MARNGIEIEWLDGNEVSQLTVDDNIYSAAL